MNREALARVLAERGELLKQADDLSAGLTAAINHITKLEQMLGLLQEAVQWYVDSLDQGAVQPADLAELRQAAARCVN